MQTVYSCRDGKRVNELCEENPESVKETDLRDKRKVTLSFPEFLHLQGKVILSPQKGGVIIS